MIPADRFVDVARAIEAALADHQPIGIPFEHDAKVFLAALNACEVIAKEGRVAPAEFGFADEFLVGGTPPGVAPTVAATGVLKFTAQPKDGDGFSIGKTRYQFCAAAKAPGLRTDIVIGADLPVTIGATVLAINGPTPPVPSRGPLVTAINSSPDTITVAAKEPGEPLLPVQTVAWSKMLSPEDKAAAERAKKADEAAAANAKAPDDPLKIHDDGTMSIGGKQVVGVVPDPLVQPVVRPAPFVARPVEPPLVDPTAPPPPFVPPPNVEPPAPAPLFGGAGFEQTPAPSPAPIPPPAPPMAPSA